MYTDITIILDASGSMSSDAEKTREAINEFVKTQQNQPGKCTINLWQFSAQSYSPLESSWLKEIWSNLNVNEIKELSCSSYVPNGMTALYDAVGTVMDKTGERYASMKPEDRPQKVLFVVMTDGGENSSQGKYRNIKVLKDAIQHQETKYSWNFVFLGASFDAAEHTSAVGLDASRTYNYDKANSVKAWGALGFATNHYRGSAQSKVAANFSEVIAEKEKEIK